MFSVDNTRDKFPSSYADNLVTKTADASFPGLLSLGDPEIGRRGYVECLSGLIRLRELRGSVQATTTDTSKMLRQKRTRVDAVTLAQAELLPALKSG